MINLRKLFYYSEITLLFEIFFNFLLVSFFCALGKFNFLFNLISSQRGGILRNQSKEKIIRYVNLCSFFCRKLGIADTCFTRALLLCFILRKAGFDSKVNFGVRKENGRLIGHCWVNQIKEEGLAYQLIFTYPS